MGHFLGTFQTRDLDMEMNLQPTFDSNIGFKTRRTQRKMVACEEDLMSARVPPQYRDYCAHILLNYLVCRYKHMPFVYKCAHEKHNYMNCEQADYVLRMKEFEREKRLRQREKRLKQESNS
ncbi:unnamed protein product [Diatraea saccharalis]|uniref:NADH dehydrogenase [ubiquinone] 1 beta subcomplex subunit 7 n=1 Tax=Diatraea saccharalis TaxID=40085 RepID=A0A9N9N0M8_9NEOP|nr:unnamed protein product [Diatraea saccharalis]